MKRRALRHRYGHAKWHGYESREFAASWPVEDLAPAVEALARTFGAFTEHDLASTERGADRRRMDTWTAKRSIDAMTARGLLKRSGKGYGLTAKGQRWIDGAKATTPVSNPWREPNLWAAQRLRAASR
jgi:hypothetical protein